MYYMMNNNIKTCVKRSERQRPAKVWNVGKINKTILWLQGEETKAGDSRISYKIIIYVTPNISTYIYLLCTYGYILCAVFMVYKLLSFKSIYHGTLAGTSSIQRWALTSFLLV